MQESQILPLEEVPHPKPGKKKSSSQSTSTSKKGEVEKGKCGSAGSAMAKKTTKRTIKADAYKPFQTTDGSASESLPDSSSYGGDYRELRHKYLVLEEASLSLDEQMDIIESEVKALEDEKHALLDQLVVLEGLIDPSELKPKEAR
ncbi:hypothetical protein HPP92_018846 [Vanilla planifolia]|uniref:Uncharacterized protein n=1 Tax=Vanilla planifolia TaxID=51239 RepID=A0A835QAM6_VANPL|nr:hypothetical protein HPP92_018846 [Vanilla planifolia]